MMKKSTAIFFILFLITVGQLSIDLYLPSMPSMAREWQVTNNLIQQTMTAFLMGYAVSQLFYGPISDRYGRKLVLYAGLVLYLLASIICAMAPSVHVLIYARVVQGIGAGAASVLSRAIMRDLFSGRELAKVSAYSSIAWSAVPLLAPVFGGYIQHYVGWRANFWVMAGMGVVAIIMSLVALQETRNKENISKLHTLSVLKNYGMMFSSPTFLGNIFTLMAMYGAMVAFNIAAPFILQNRLGLNSVQYGWIVIIVTIGYLVGSVIASRLADFFSYQKIIYIGMSLYMLTTFLFLFFGIIHVLNLWVFLLPMFFMMVASSIVYPTATAGAMLPFSNLAGSAGALYGFVVIAGGSLISLLVGYLNETTQIPLAITFVSMGAVAVLGYYFFVTLTETPSESE